MFGVKVDEMVDVNWRKTRGSVSSCRVPMTEKTKNVLSAENIAKTKKGVRIINCARGGLVDEVALRAALDSGHVAGAAFDVFVEELDGRDEVCIANRDDGA